MSDSSILNFSSPPIYEVSFSVLFESPFNFNVLQLGQVCDFFSGVYPQVEHHVPIERVIERKDRPKKQQLSIDTIQFFNALNLPRVWLINESGEYLIQIQNDRFVRNWKKIDSEYPRYSVLKPQFESDLNKYLGFIKENFEIDPRVAQCELTYVNHIKAENIEDTHAEINKLFKCCTIDPGISDDIEFEDAGYNQRYLIQDEGKFIGRLYVKSNPAFLNKDGTPVYVLTLIARGMPLEEGIEGVFSFFDKGRELIVKAFDRITEADMHKKWGKEE